MAYPRPTMNGEEMITVFEALHILIEAADERDDPAEMAIPLGFVKMTSYRELTTQLITIQPGVQVLMAGLAAHHNRPKILSALLDRAPPSAWDAPYVEDEHRVCITPLNAAIAQRNTSLALDILSHRVYKEYSGDCAQSVSHSLKMAQHVFGATPSEEEARLLTELANFKR